MPSVQEVEELLRTALEATEVDVTDISGEYVSASVTSRPPRLFPRTIRPLPVDPSDRADVSPPVRHSCGSSFEVSVVSKQFQGKALLARHRLVHNALGALMESIHALSIKSAKTPEQAAA